MPAPKRQFTERHMKKETLAQLAQETLQILEAGAYTTPAGRRVELAAAVAASIAGTRLHREDTTRGVPRIRESAMRLSVTAETTFEAIVRMHRAGVGELAALNFASARKPGGGFLGGAQAQEEALARSSTLYPCLLTQPEYYERNRGSDSLLYLDLLIYAPRVAFFRTDAGALLESPVLASIITSPAPNAGAVRQNQPENLPRVPEVLLRRAMQVLAVAEREGVERLILGAWGCGVFRNDPRMVARTFASLLRGDGAFARSFSEVVFAIYDNTPERSTLAAFRAELET